MTYFHNDTDETHLTLHDCRANHAELKDGKLSFFFPDGFWVISTHPDNPTGKTVRTGPARVDFVLREPEGDDISIEVFRELKWPHSLRTAWELPKLLAAINEKHWELEFLYQYPGGWDRVIECWFWFRRRPWHKECRLKLDVKEAIYRWNDLREERVW